MKRPAPISLFATWCLALCLVAVPGSASADPLTVVFADGCCCLDTVDCTVSRSPDPVCNKGHKATGVRDCGAPEDYIPFIGKCSGVGCISEPGDCRPDVGPTSYLLPIQMPAEFPDNGKDDDCDGIIDDQGCNGIDNDGDGLIDEDVGGCLMRILVVPQCWKGDDASFRLAAQQQFNFFLTNLGVDACRNNLSLSVIPPSTLNLSCGNSTLPGAATPGTGDPRCDAVPEDPAVVDTWPEELFGDKRIASAGALANLGQKRGNFDEIMGLTDQNLCGPIAGENLGNGFLWAENSDTIILSHEVGHSYDLADEYCSQEAGGDTRCAGGPAAAKPRINFLGSDLFCDPRNGNGCCTNCAADAVNHPGEGNHYSCCQGNQNPDNGRCTMSSTLIFGDRKYCTRCRNQITSPKNPRTAANVNGNQPLTCAAVRQIGALTVMNMDMSLRSDGRLLAIKQFGFDFGRASLDGVSTSGRFGLDVRDASGIPLHATTFDFVNRETPGGPLPALSVEERGFRFAVPVGIGQATKMKVAVSASGGVFFTTLNGAPPTVNAGVDRIVECTGGGVGALTLQGSASDPDGDTLNTLWSATGATFVSPEALTTAATFPVGVTTTVSLTASDAVLPTVADTMNVTVVDHTKPIVKAPPDTEISTCKNPNLGKASATDSCQGALEPRSDAPAVFPLGTTIVTWRAVDAFGNVGTAVQRVTAVLGDDPSCCPPGTNIILGNDASNQLVGTSGRDCILGRGGDDVIDGRDGDDFISGGAGRDTIFGGNGNDTIYGNDGDDIINAAPGTNFIDGGSGTDTCFVTPGKDTAVRCNP